jgi:hypothetical protein
MNARAVATAPLAWASFVFHGLMRALLMVTWVLGILLRKLKSRRRPGGTAPADARVQPAWRLFSAQCEDPSLLPTLSILGPRWNCHAMIASLGPVEVYERVTCRVGELQEKSESWTIVAYDKRMATAAFSGSWTAGDAVAEHGEATFELAPGRYMLSLRCYAEEDRLVLPDVVIDGRAMHCGRVVEGEMSRYARALERIRGYNGFFYRALHYYVFHQLAYAPDAKPEWLRRHFLPVGNPETEWHYGHLQPGERLRLELGQHDAERVITFVCFYNWASFPVFWLRVRDQEWVSPRFESKLGYAIRRVPKFVAAREGASWHAPSAHFSVSTELQPL